MSINNFRGILYKVAKYLGDFQAISKSAKSGSAQPIFKRIIRRLYGKIAGRGMGKL